MAVSNIFIPPKDAAERLGVSASGLRRLATLYEGLYGPLPRATPSDTSSSRVWPTEAVERLETARALVSRGRAKSIQDALTGLGIGDTGASEGLAPVPLQGPPHSEALAILIDEVRAMRHELADLKRENLVMQRQLEAPKRIAVIDNSQADELRQMNAYLLGELERRRLEDEARVKPRSWWKLWG